MTKAPRGRRWENFARLVIAHYGGICWICAPVCGGGGARQVDHVIPVTERPDLVWELSNCRAAHGAPGNPCPRCGTNCNQIRGGLSVERARRIIAGRAAERQGARPQAQSRPDPDAGRPW